jgi:hypothetical protein
VMRRDFWYPPVPPVCQRYRLRCSWAGRGLARWCGSVELTRGCCCQCASPHSCPWFLRGRLFPAIVAITLDWVSFARCPSSSELISPPASSEIQCDLRARLVCALGSLHRHDASDAITMP